MRSLDHEHEAALTMNDSHPQRNMSQQPLPSAPPHVM
jgi:hypothetical protein